MLQACELALPQRSMAMALRVEETTSANDSTGSHAMLLEALLLLCMRKHSSVLHLMAIGNDAPGIALVRGHRNIYRPAQPTHLADPA